MVKTVLKFILSGLALLIGISCSKTKTSAWPSYTTASGLAGNYINAIAIDGNNNIWFGTNYGVTEFDGTHWTTYNKTNTQNGLFNNIVHTIAIDPNGNLWFGTTRGLTEFNGSWSTTFPLDTLHEIHSNTDTINGKDTIIKIPYPRVDTLSIYSIAIDNAGVKWVATNFGISKFDGTQWTNFIDTVVKPDTLRSYGISIDAEGNKWFGTIYGVAVAVYQNKTDTIQKFYTTNDSLVNNGVSCIEIDAQGNKWIGTDGGVSEYTKNNHWENYANINGLGTIWVTSIAFDLKGNTWFGTGGGVTKFNGAQWTTYTIDNGLIGTTVNAIVCDKQGNAWIGTTMGVTEILAGK